MSTPEVAFVSISAEHVPSEIVSNRVSKADFQIPTFGSRHLPDAFEIDESLIISWSNKKSQLKNIINSEDFLRIGLFDLWMANEDRHHNNYNLMIAAEETGNILYAIDHEKCFNSAIFDKDHPIQLLTADESLLRTPLVPLLFNNEFHLEGVVKGILDEYGNYINVCKDELPAILQQIPESWGINTVEIAILLQKNIFAPEWIDQTAQSFKEYLA